MLDFNIYHTFLDLSYPHQISWVLGFIYLLITCYFSLNWLIFAARNPSSVPEDKFLSLVMFAITSLLWPIGIITSCLESIKLKKIQFSIAIACLIALTISMIFLY